MYSQHPGRHRISFCTVCMGRLDHLQQTLPKNMADNADYPDLEFALLDYHSPDGLEDWVKTEMREHLDSGRLVYYRTTEPEHFHSAHARNAVFRLATGELLCNIDADQYAGRGFAEYVDGEFSDGDRSFLIPDVDGRHGKCAPDVVGRVCVRRADFLRIGGYDEAMSIYGWEDVDLYSRLQRSGLTPKLLLNDEFLSYIAHPNYRRTCNEAVAVSLEAILTDGREPWEFSVLIYLHKDGRFQFFDDPEDKGVWTEGQWHRDGSETVLHWSTGQTARVVDVEKGRTYVLERNGVSFELRQLSDPDRVGAELVHYSLRYGELQYARNVSQDICHVNGNRFGLGIFRKNFVLPTVLEQYAE